MKHLPFAAFMLVAVGAMGYEVWDILDNPITNSYPIAAVVLSSAPPRTVPIEVAGVPSYRNESASVTVRIVGFGNVVTIHELPRMALSPGECVWVDSSIGVYSHRFLTANFVYSSDDPKPVCAGGKP